MGTTESLDDAGDGEGNAQTDENEAHETAFQLQREHWQWAVRRVSPPSCRCRFHDEKCWPPGSDPMETPESMSMLVYPASLSLPFFRRKGQRVSELARQYSSAVAEYMCAELVELSGNIAEREGRKYIRASDIERVYMEDEELRVARHMIEGRIDTEPDPPLEVHRSLVRRLEEDWKKSTRERMEEEEEEGCPIKRRRLVKDSTLAQALLTGDEADVRTALADCKEDINAPIEVERDCLTPFELALERGDRTITRLLIEHGARTRATPNIVVAAVLACDPDLVRSLWSTGAELPCTVVDLTHDIFPLCLRGHEFGVMRTMIQATLDPFITPIDLFVIIAEYAEPCELPHFIQLELGPPNISYRRLAERLFVFAQCFVHGSVARPPEFALDSMNLEDEKFQIVCDRLASSLGGGLLTLLVEDSVSSRRYFVVGEHGGVSLFMWEGDNENFVQLSLNNAASHPLIDCWTKRAEPWFPLCED